LLERIFNFEPAEDLDLRFQGLESGRALQEFVHDGHPRIGLLPETRTHLWNELLSALRALGRFDEADAFERSGPPDDNRPESTQSPSAHPPAKRIRFEVT
jgi:hypothetical protein